MHTSGSGVPSARYRQIRTSREGRDTWQERVSHPPPRFSQTLVLPDSAAGSASHAA